MRAGRGRPDMIRRIRKGSDELVEGEPKRLVERDRTSLVEGEPSAG